MRASTSSLLLGPSLVRDLGGLMKFQPRVIAPRANAEEETWEGGKEGRGNSFLTTCLPGRLLIGPASACGRAGAFSRNTLRLSSEFATGGAGHGFMLVCNISGTKPTQNALQYCAQRISIYVHERNFIVRDLDMDLRQLAGLMIR